MIRTHIQCVSGEAEIPRNNDLRNWVETALQCIDRGEADLTLRLVGLDEMQKLNARYRNKDEPTNVLSFSFDIPSEVQNGLFGDIIICVPVVEQEARNFQLPCTDRWAHMIVHGVLHLCGYDHNNEDEAFRMEQLEGNILQHLGFADPYN